MSIKNILIVSLIVLTTNSLKSQVVSDSVTLGAGYSNQVFYKLSDGTKTVSSNTDWDIQFFSSLFTASIRVNSGVGVELYQAVSTDTTNFATATLDTSSLTILRDQYISWEHDAFTSQQTGHPNYGWGNYQGAGNIIGYKVYAIKLSSGVFKKIWMKEFKTSGDLTFSIADLNGSNLVTKTINRGTYSAKRHFYFDVENDTILDVEPGKTSWELLFRKYSDTSGPGYYNVTGVLSNYNMGIAQVDNVLTSTAKSNWNTYPLDSSINVIGYDWKSFNMSTFSWDIKDSLSFIMKDNNGDVFQIIFTGTTGSSTGKMYFTKELISAVSLEENSPLANFSVFPNPAISNLTINFELLSSTDAIQINVIDVNGKIVKSISNSFEGQGFQSVNTNIVDLSKGMYFVRIQSGKSIITKKFIKQ